MKPFVFLVFTLLCGAAYSQLNMTLRSQIDYQQLHNTLLNDIWGYVDQEGNEYALIGARLGVSVVSLADPDNPVEVHWHAGQNSVWRDLKTYGNYAYITTEAEAGLLIMDLSPLPNGPIVTEVYYPGAPGNNWQSAHNLYIDENGYCYIFGANRGNGGVIILDVATDPLNPIEVGVFDNWYVHDGFARDNILYLAHIFAGTISMVDVTDKANPVLLGTANTPSNFAHNIWPSDDGNFVFTTDEVSGAFLASFDVSDPTNIVEVDRIQSSPGAGVVPHNVHVYQDWLVTSYYTDGITVHDISRPHNMVEVGNYDTSPLQTTNTEGCWGAYPFLPSGLVLASDMQEGFFVLQPDYRNAAFLEGTCTDALTGNALQDVQVAITTGNQSVLSQNNGFYATGIAGTNTYEVSFLKPLYFPQSHDIALIEGEVVEFDVELVPIPNFPFQLTVLEEGTNNPIVDAQFLFQVPLNQASGTTNGLGIADFSLYYQEEYEIFVGKWGYFTYCDKLVIDEDNNTLTVFLKPGLYDDFMFDFGWSTISTAEAGHWVREVPIGTTSGSAPGVDAAADCGNMAYITGNGSMNSNIDQVIKGEVILISPVFDLTSYSDPHVNYQTWYYNFHGPNPPPDDTLKIFLSNGTENVVIDLKYYPDSPASQWIPS
jgi:choice-of-anchor B domain-containing protein